MRRIRGRARGDSPLRHGRKQKVGGGDRAGLYDDGLLRPKIRCVNCDCVGAGLKIEECIAAVWLGLQRARAHSDEGIVNRLAVVTADGAFDDGF